MGEEVYRAPMRARDRDEPGADHGLAHDLVGIGPGSGEKAERMRRRFAELPDGALVWTRDSAGAYFLGRIAGPCRRGTAAGLTYVRPATWLDRPFAEDEVPPAVAATFARGGKNLQRIHGDAVERRSAELWARHAG